MDDLTVNPQQPAPVIDIEELIGCLQHERLLVGGERRAIQELNEKLVSSVEELLRRAWINLQQRVNLNALVGAGRDCTEEQCCQKANSLANSFFIEAKEVLDYQVIVNYSHFFSWLRTRPELVAQWIVIGEALSQDQRTFIGILHSLVGGLYGSLQLPQDISLMLSLLQYLARLQLVTTDNPRRLLKQGSCAFSRMYFLFHECLTSAKLFLIASLQAPILKLIANSEAFLDIDPNKTLSRLSPVERAEKFGEEGTEAYAANISHHRKWVVKTLTDLTKAFITSLQENVHCFPDTLAWLIRRIAHMIAKSFSPHSKEINGISTDLIFTLFICPAIVQPEPYGICDAPISETARHNLMQIGQIMQMLALAKFETPDDKFKDFYGSFDVDCVTSILDVVLNSMEDAEDEIPIGVVPGVHRSIALFTEQELYNLTAFLKRAQSSILQEQGNTANEAASTAGSDYCSNNGDSIVLLPNDPLVILLNKLPTEKDEGSPRNTLSNNTSPTHSNGAAKKTHTLLLNKAKSFTRNTLVNGDCNEQMHPTTVLIIPLHQEDEELIGLLTEEKVLAMHAIETGEPIIDPPELVDEILTNSGQEKRTRFSHADEGSIGNTSDNLEVISEAASNHSVASSIELENEDQNDMNDNLSDMVSANVSGRGTPNISGRDTPSSQVTENEDNRPLAEARQPYMPQPRPPNISKQIGSDIEDKFCKFEIKKLLEGEETISIISDTWSTDVLASDSETIDAGEPRSFPAIIEQPLMDTGLQNPLLDVSETQSESAWSTDVLASDTERLTEVDNDDIVSVAPSDDTASVARSDDAASVAPSEVDDQNLNDRRLSTASNHFVSFQSSQNSPSAFQEYRRIDVTVRRESMPNYITAIKTEQESHVLTYSSTVETNILRPFSRNIGLDTSKREAILLDNKTADSIQKRPILGDISNSNELPGPSKTEGTSSYALVKQINDMQLSNTSLNSSSSGSSSNSETRNKNGVNKSWLNGSESSLSTDGNKNKVIVRPKPSISTGAIPKSISFDMSAEKGDKDEDDSKKKGGFFGKLRINFKHRRGKNFRSTDECSGVRFDVEDGGVKKFTEFTSTNGGVKTSDTTDYNILDKYRTKHTSENGAVLNITKGSKTPEEEESQLLIGFSVDSNLLYSDAKKKLRLVLSNTRTQHFRGRKDTKKHIKKDLESFLQIELAKAKDLSQWSTAARVAEALRCIRLLDISTFNKLCENLKGDLCTRSVYLKYLLRSKQTLLSSQEYLKELFAQVNRDQELCASFLVSLCVRVFLEKHEQEVQNFCEEFKKLTLVDEKNDLLASFLRSLFTRMRKDPLWTEGSNEQIELAQVAVERSVMTEVYMNALYPNGDGDRHRDSLLSSHLRKLASMISPNHKYLLINKIYQNECPWLPAQEALRAMAAYKTPRDKLRCVVRCASAIMDLLSLAQGSSATADDLVPVIVYVIIQANPPDLLSTIQYVNSFYGNLSGEDDYWWTQFCSAVEYTKTMEYTD